MSAPYDYAREIYDARNHAEPIEIDPNDNIEPDERRRRSSWGDRCD